MMMLLARESVCGKNVDYISSLKEKQIANY